MEPKKIEISHRTIIFTVLFLISLSVLWQIRSLIVLLYVCLIFMVALNPAVRRLERYKIPRPLAIIVLYLLILAFLSFAVAGIIPLLVEQTTGLIQTLPNTISNISIFGTSAVDLSSQFRILENLPSEIASFTISLFSNIFSGFIVFVITFYLLLERPNLDKYSFSLFGHAGKEKMLLITEKLEKTLGSWVNAELLLMTTIGLLSYLGYLLLGLKYAVPLAIIAGILELVPNIGPTVSTVLAGLVGLTISPLTALMAIIWGIIVQQLENNLIVPKIMKETVGINPIITIIMIAIGAQLAGIIGAILAIPLYLTITTIFRSLNQK